MNKRGMKKITIWLVLFIILILIPNNTFSETVETMDFISNGIIKMGVNLQWGGGIGWFSYACPFVSLDNEKNLLNRADTGRNIQQSFYGALNEFFYNYQKWRYNPVQGGDAYGNNSPIEAGRRSKTTYYTATHPLDWAQDNVLDPCLMEQWIVLKENLAQIHYRFTNYDGGVTDEWTGQEMPALYFLLSLEKLVYYNGNNPWSNDELFSLIPEAQNPPKGKPIIPYFSSPLDKYHKPIQPITETWAAYLDQQDWGCGVYFPSTYQIGYFRNYGENPESDTSPGSSYFAPFQVWPMQANLVKDYTIYLVIGYVTDIRNTFKNIHYNGLQLLNNGSFEDENLTVSVNDDGTVKNLKWAEDTDSGGIHQFCNAGGKFVNDGLNSVSLIAQSPNPGITWEKPFYYQDIEGVTPGINYQLQYSGRSENLNDGYMGIRIIQFNENNESIDDSGIIPETVITGNNDYIMKKCTIKFKNETTKIQIRLQLASKDSFAQVWFDSVKLNLEDH